MPGDIHQDLIMTVRLTHAGTCEKTGRNACQLFLCEGDGAAGFVNVSVEIRGQLSQLFAQALDPFALFGGQRQARATKIAKGFVEEQFLLTDELRLGVGVRLDRSIDIISILEFYSPRSELYRNLRRSVADGFIGM